MSAQKSLTGRILRRIGRAIEGPPVRERVVVKRVDRSRPGGLKPGFIIGVYRSGTTLLRYILDSHRNIAVPPETNFLLGLAELWRSEWYRRGFQGVGVDENGLLEELREFVRGIFDSYAIAKAKSRWFDKTPCYINSLDFIDALFGKECSYIMLYRNALDVTNSLTKMQQNRVLQEAVERYAEEYSGSLRLGNARYWSEQCEKMMAFEAAHPDQCFRLFYEQFSVHPERHLRPLFEFLHEPWDPEVLNFMAKQHDFGLQDSKILETKGLLPHTSTYRSWPANELAKAKEIVAHTMKTLGYEI